MCDPASLTAAALIAGSVGANYLGNKAVARKQASLQGWENARQANWQDQIGNLVTTEASKFGGDQFTGDLEAKRAKISTSLKDAISANTDFLPAAGALEAPKIIMDDANKRLQKSTDYATSQADARANVMSLGDLMGDRGVDLGRSAGQVNTIGNFMQGSANVLPLEMQGAQSVGANHRLVADILQAAGSAAMTKALAAPAAQGGVRGAGVTSGPSIVPGLGANARTYYLPVR